MRRALFLLAVGSALLAFASPAFADHDHSSDGTLNETELDWGAPPLASIDGCDAIVDPPIDVYITFHYELVDGTVGHDTKLYVWDETGWLRFPLPGVVADGWFTWNIGLGESEHFSGGDDCFPTTTTTTTAASTTTTTVPVVTSTTVLIDVPVTPPPGESFTTDHEPSVVPQAADELPRTGNGVPFGVGLVLVAAGVALVLTQRNKEV